MCASSALILGDVSWYIQIIEPNRYQRLVNKSIDCPNQSTIENMITCLFPSGRWMPTCSLTKKIYLEWNKRLQPVCTPCGYIYSINWHACPKYNSIILNTFHVNISQQQQSKISQQQGCSFKNSATPLNGSERLSSINQNLARIS
jgi:hypothetical protein